MYNSDSDTVPAMLTPGEAVIPAPAAQNPENKPIIKAMVEEGRAKNDLEDGTTSVNDPSIMNNPFLDSSRINEQRIITNDKQKALNNSMNVAPPPEVKLAPPSMKELADFARTQTLNLVNTPSLSANVNLKDLSNPIIQGRYTSSSVPGLTFSGRTDLSGDDYNLRANYVKRFNQGTMEVMGGSFFDKLFENVLKVEGGFNPKEVESAGGASNYGVTLNTFKKVTNNPNATVDDLRNLSVDQAKDIYRTEYYEKPGINKLPRYVQSQVFDHAVNAGPDAAIKLVQDAAGVTQDGIIGEQTINALQDNNVIDKYKANRLAFYQGLADSDPEQYSRFQDGWINRVNNLTDVNQDETLSVTEVGFTPPKQQGSILSSLNPISSAAAQTTNTSPAVSTVSNVTPTLNKTQLSQFIALDNDNNQVDPNDPNARIEHYVDPQTRNIYNASGAKLQPDKSSFQSNIKSSAGIFPDDNLTRQNVSNLYSTVERIDDRIASTENKIEQGINTGNIKLVESATLEKERLQKQKEILNSQVNSLKTHPYVQQREQEIQQELNAIETKIQNSTDANLTAALNTQKQAILKVQNDFNQGDYFAGTSMAAGFRSTIPGSKLYPTSTGITPPVVSQSQSAQTQGAAGQTTQTRPEFIEKIERQVSELPEKDKKSLMDRVPKAMRRGLQIAADPTALTLAGVYYTANKILGYDDKTAMQQAMVGYAYGQEERRLAEKDTGKTQAELYKARTDAITKLKADARANFVNKAKKYKLEDLEDEYLQIEQLFL